MSGWKVLPIVVVLGCQGRVVFGEFAATPVDSGMPEHESSIGSSAPDAAIADAPDASIDRDVLTQDTAEASCGTPPIAVVVTVTNRVIPIYLVGADTPDDVVASELVYFQRCLA